MPVTTSSYSGHDDGAWSRSEYSSSSLSLPSAEGSSSTSSSSKPAPPVDACHGSISQRVAFDLVLPLKPTDVFAKSRSKSMEVASSTDSSPAAAIAAGGEQTSTVPTQDSKQTDVVTPSPKPRVSRFVEHIDFDPELHRLVYASARSSAVRKSKSSRQGTSVAPPQSTLAVEAKAADASVLQPVDLSVSSSLAAVTSEAAEVSQPLSTTALASSPSTRSQNSSNAPLKDIAWPDTTPASSENGPASAASSSSRPPPRPARSSSRKNSAGSQDLLRAVSSSKDTSASAEGISSVAEDSPSSASFGPDMPSHQQLFSANEAGLDEQSLATLQSRPASPPIPARSPLRSAQFGSLSGASGRSGQVDDGGSGPLASSVTRGMLRSLSSDDSLTPIGIGLSGSTPQSHSRGLSLPTSLHIASPAESTISVVPGTPTAGVSSSFTASNAEIIISPSEEPRLTVDETSTSTRGKRSGSTAPSWRRFLLPGIASTTLSPHPETQRPASVVGVVPTTTADDDEIEAIPSTVIDLDVDNANVEPILPKDSAYDDLEDEEAPIRPFIQRLFSAPPTVHADGSMSANGSTASFFHHGFQIAESLAPPVQRKLVKPKVSLAEKARRAREAKELAEWEEKRRLERTVPRGFVKTVLFARTN